MTAGVTNQTCVGLPVAVLSTFSLSSTTCWHTSAVCPWASLIWLTLNTEGGCLTCSLTIWPERVLLNYFLFLAWKTENHYSISVYNNIWLSGFPSVNRLSHEFPRYLNIQTKKIFIIWLSLRKIMFILSLSYRYLTIGLTFPPIPRLNNSQENSSLNQDYVLLQSWIYRK